MPIRSHESAQSQTRKLEKDWFKKAEKNDSELSRFVYMEIGTRKNFWEWKKDISDSNIDMKDTTFLIDQEKFVNRPDAIAYEVYGNSKYWWLIALRNDIKEPFYEFFKGRTLKIPSLVAAKKELGFG